MTDRFDPFIKQCLGAEYMEVPFEDLTISTATIDVRAHIDTGLNYEQLYYSLPVIPKKVYESISNYHWPEATVYAAKFENLIRGAPPNEETKAFKNSTMIWMWLKEKPVNIKVSSNNFHITGCKKLEHAAEAVRLLQGHIQLLSPPSGGNKVDDDGNGDDDSNSAVTSSVALYKNFPHALRFDVCMINYNFKLGVALDLPKFDIFTYKNFPKLVYSPYDQNINKTSMPMKCPVLSITYTINDNGQVSMCTAEADIEKSYDNVCKGYEVFYVMVNAFRDDINGK